MDLADAATQWRTEGWVLIDGLVPTAEVAAARAEIEGRDLDPPAVRGPLRRADEHARGEEREPAFREEQFAGTTLFPIPDAPLLNRLCVHPRILDFAEQAIGGDDLRLYQSRLWSKFGGRADYEQPLHQDRNHSLVPVRPEASWWFMECFFYLSDVDETNGAPKLVPRSETGAEPPAGVLAKPDEHAHLYEAERSAPGPAGSLLAYRSDVWHRGTPIDDGAERHILVLAFRRAGQDWIGFDSHPPLVNNREFLRFANESTPRELALFGVPLPGHPYWTTETLDAMAQIYRGLDLDPWRAAFEE